MPTRDQVAALVDHTLLKPEATAAEVAVLASSFAALRLLRHKRSCGQSTAVRSGVRAALAPWIATLDGDRLTPDWLPGLWAVQFAGGRAAAVDKSVLYGTW